MSVPDSQQPSTSHVVSSNDDTISTVTSTSSIKDSKWITLNVGGRKVSWNNANKSNVRLTFVILVKFSTTRSTLTNKAPNSMLARMFGQDGMMTPSDTDETGAYLIDRSAQYFEPIINFLRHGQLIRDDGISLHGILEEAKFFGIDGLIPHLEHLITVTSPVTDAPLTRRDVVKAIIRTSNESVLRFQGVNLAGADLSKLDLRYINFKVNDLDAFLKEYYSF